MILDRLACCHSSSGVAARGPGLQETAARPPHLGRIAPSAVIAQIKHLVANKAVASLLPPPLALPLPIPGSLHRADNMTKVSLAVSTRVHGRFKGDHLRELSCWESHE
eukprot:6397426-Prymnesium_polylepis.1